MYYAFVDLEKAYDRVPREVTRWALRKAGVEEGLINAIMALYEEAWTVVRTGDGDSEGFEVKVGLHQGSVLSPLLFLIVMEAVSSEVRGGLPWELLYADDLVLMAGGLEELKEKLNRWKMALENKGMKVNIDKTKVMGGKQKVIEQDKGLFPCAVCHRGVGRNSIQCKACGKWLHKKCSGVKGRLTVKSILSECAKCVASRNTTEARDPKEGEEVPQNKDGGKVEIEIEKGVRLEMVHNFCYLGDIIDVNGGVETAITRRIQKAWCKFRELRPILTRKGLAPKIKGRVYSACVRSTMVYGSETWPMKEEQEQKLERVEMQMVRWMCGVKLADGIKSEELLKKLGIEAVRVVLKKGRLRWWGHVERREDMHWLKKCMKFEVEGKKPVGRPRKTWSEVIRKDMKDWGLKEEMALNRREWRKGLRRQNGHEPLGV